VTKYISKAKLAEMGGVAKQSIGGLCRYGKPLYEAVDERTNKVDLDHPAVITWLEKKQGKTPTKRELRESGGTLANDLSTEAYGQLTVNQICENYGSITELQEYIKTNKIIAETEHRKIQIAQVKGDLVSRDLVARACFGMIEIAYKRLLEIPTGSLERIIGLLESKMSDSKQQAEELLIAQISKILKGTKKEVANILKIEHKKEEADEL
jgi:hypothetical protein